MSVKFVLTVLENGKPPSRSIRFDLTPASNPRKSVFTGFLDPEGRIEVSTDLPGNIRALRFFLTDEKTDERLHASASIKVREVPDRFDLEIGQGADDEAHCCDEATREQVCHRT